MWPKEKTSLSLNLKACYLGVGNRVVLCNRTGRSREEFQFSISNFLTTKAVQQWDALSSSIKSSIHSSIHSTNTVHTLYTRHSTRCR